MNILLVNTLYYPKFVGGAEISVQLLAEALVNEGHEISVITLSEQDEMELINGVRVHRIKYRNLFPLYDGKERNVLLKSLWHIVDSYNPFYEKKLYKLLKRIQPDVVHTHNIQGFSPALWAAVKRLRIPLAHTMRDYYLLCHRNNLYNGSCNCDKLCNACAITHKIKRRFLKLPDTWIGISAFMLKKHQEFHCFNRTQLQQVVYNAVNIPSDLPLTNPDGEKIRLGYMGRITADKGLDYLVQELQKVQKAMPESFSLSLAGRGEDVYIKGLRESLQGLDVKFLGVVTPEDFYKDVDVSIVPSKWNEPFGRVVIESLAYGTPVCIAAVGGLKEIHREDCTWLFEPSKKDLSILLIKILKNKYLIEEKARKSKAYAENFSVERNVDNYLKIYNELKKARR